MSISGPGSLSGDIKNYSDSAEVNLPFTACSLAVCIHTHETLIVAPEVDSSYMSVLDPEGVVRLLYTVNRETCVCMPHRRASVLNANGLTSVLIGGTVS